jgi:hypothetical protein
VIPLVIAITFHEASHGYVARLCGDDTAWRLGRVSLNPLKLLPYSGAQLVDVNDTVSVTGIGADVRERRRIEIRLRKSDKIVILPPGLLATSIPKNKPMAPPTPEPSPAEHIVPQAEAFPEAEMQVESDAQPTQPAPPPRQFRPFRWMFRN